jgi:hypothetical protein
MSTSMPLIRERRIINSARTEIAVGRNVRVARRLQRRLAGQPLPKTGQSPSSLIDLLGLAWLSYTMVILWYENCLVDT